MSAPPKEPPWAAEALQRIIAGESRVSLARAYGVSSQTITRWTGGRERQMEASRLYREKKRQQAQDALARLPYRPSSSERSEAILTAARAFAKGEIDRTELMRRLPRPMPY